MATKRKRPRSGRGTRPAAERSTPKTTRPEAGARREQEPVPSTAEAIGRKFDAQPDRIDIRDWFYRPTLAPLPDQMVNCDLVPAILDQGSEGACTGFALASVINYHLARRNVKRLVSPRMLYDMARRYDEWPGEEYEGSSARGAMKGWVAHGVCSAASWAMDKHGAEHLTPAVADEAQGTPGGAYYRVKHREVRDMHAALAEAGVLYATLMVHKGWDRPGPKEVTVSYAESGNYRQRTLPVIQRSGRADSGHAIAIVGYTPDGFIIQNSWGDTWGAGGFALLPYEDFLLHATDVWVAQLGVPVRMKLWTEGRAADDTAGLHRAARAIPLNEIRPYVIDIGNNGELSRTGVYWTTEEDLDRLFTEVIPAHTRGWSRSRILLYLHGGLNEEAAVARRIVAYRDVCLENEIYPVHIMWETGVTETLNGLFEDLFTDVDERAGGVADWLRDARDGLLEARDRTLELTAAVPGGALWGEMKENARLASSHPERKGGMQLVVRHAEKALRKLDPAAQKKWEVHLVGHSAGSIFAAYAMRHLVDLGVTLKTLQFMAPAMTVELFKDVLLPHVKKGACPHPSVFVLSDVGERDDEVGPYGKSLLYLVSNAFEGKRETPLLGMERFISDRGQAGAQYADPEMVRFFERPVDGLPSLIVAGTEDGPASLSRSESHGGFDNDADTLNSVLRRILGGQPKRLFTVRDLQFEGGTSGLGHRSRGRAVRRRLGAERSR